MFGGQEAREWPAGVQGGEEGASRGARDRLVGSVGEGAVPEPLQAVPRHDAHPLLLPGSRGRPRDYVDRRGTLIADRERGVRDGERATAPRPGTGIGRTSAGEAPTQKTIITQHRYLKS